VGQEAAGAEAVLSNGTGVAAAAALLGRKLFDKRRPTLVAIEIKPIADHRREMPEQRQRKYDAIRAKYTMRYAALLEKQHAAAAGNPAVEAAAPGTIAAAASAGPAAAVLQSNAVLVGRFVSDRLGMLCQWTSSAMLKDGHLLHFQVRVYTLIHTLIYLRAPAALPADNGAGSM
jgi:hypothetical protein